MGLQPGLAQIRRECNGLPCFDGFFVHDIIHQSLFYDIIKPPGQYLGYGNVP